jgi:branched-chain amino acid transport system ATP-binding protein
VSPPVLETSALSKRFGALLAVDGVDLAYERTGVHAIIGPNGAGKTTLINLLSGDLKPSSGRVRLRGRDITGSPPDRVSRLGIGRSYQKTNLFPSLTCAQGCRLAARSRRPSSMRFIRPAHRDRQTREAAERALGLVGLAGRGDVPCGALSHGEQRQLELAMILATEPEVLLLDEPLAGMGRDESDRIVALLGQLARDHTIILVEHDMDAVFAVADELTVMVEGRVLDSGPPARVRANPAVRDAYLGAGDGAP